MTGKFSEVVEAAPKGWDLVVVGGGITGAGIFRLATSLGLKVLLLEQQDYAWGTSGRSGKLVHGGLRYLREGKVGLTRHSVKERERLLRQAPGLVESLGFLFPIPAKNAGEKALYGVGLTLYDLLAGRKGHRYHSGNDFFMMAPHLSQEGLAGGYRFLDAQADDARMVLRLIFEAVADGGTARNYARVRDLLTDCRGRVAGVLAEDPASGAVAEIQARAVVNATGAWADRLRRRVGVAPTLRPLRGSHLIFPAWRLPAAQAVSFLHPVDGRPVYAFPWEGSTLVGTTDLDHGADLDREPAVTEEEKAYLLAGVRHRFPDLELEAADVVATFAGVRPVVGTGKRDPSRESRDMVIAEESGLVSVTGGKLTTFRLMALETLKRLASRLVLDLEKARRSPMYHRLDPLPAAARRARRLAGRYGRRAETLLRQAACEEGASIPGTPYLWEELRHAARHEQVAHLDDLLLRRVRLGLLLPGGGLEHASRIKALVAPDLGWDEGRWAAEAARYANILQASYR
jgi:glycerol-3-phosphate dehydrogenase